MPLTCIYTMMNTLYFCLILLKAGMHLVIRKNRANPNHEVHSQLKWLAQLPITHYFRELQANFYTIYITVYCTLNIKMNNTFQQSKSSRQYSLFLFFSFLLTFVSLLFICVFHYSHCLVEDHGCLILKVLVHGVKALQQLKSPVVS